MLSMTHSSLFTVLLLALATNAHHNHAGHHVTRALPGAWYHARDHPVNDLFKREVGADGQTYPDIGSPTWTAKYPSGSPDSSQMPQEWSAALKAAVAAGKIPDIPKTSLPDPDGSPVYPQGVDANSPSVCSSTVRSCRNPADIWDAPDGTYATSFDDGPLDTSIPLLNFLKSKNEPATHFLIGITMLQGPEFLKATLATGHDIAAHTYNHPRMTTLSNEDVTAQLGWSMQIIHDSTGGKVPKYWRPPYGDSDNRVRAIAAEVFGLRTVIWNQDTEDTVTATTAKDITGNYTKWLNGPKSPGLMVLHHETSDFRVQNFISNYPAIKAAGWKMSSLSSLVDNGAGPYQNVVNGKVNVAGIIKAAGGASPPSSATGGPSPPSSTTGGSPGSPSASKTNKSASSSTSTNAPNAPAAAPTNRAMELQSHRWVVLATTLLCVAVAVTFVP